MAADDAKTQDDLDDKTPAQGAGEGGEDLEALWAEFDASDKANAGTPPDEGRDSQDADATADKDEGQGTKQAAPGAADAKPDQTDIWASAPTELRSAFEEVRKRADEAEHRYRSDAGRIAALQRQIDDLKKGGTAHGAAEGTTDKDAAPTVLASEKWKSLKQEYPEVAEPLEAVLSEMESRNHRLEKELSAIGSDRRQAARDEQDAIVRTRHQDYDAFLGQNSQQFMAWKEEQPRYVQEAIQRNWEGIVDANEFVDILDRFKSHIGASGSPGHEPPGSGKSQQLAAKRERQRQSLAAPRTSGPSVASGIPEDADPEVIWKAFEEQDRRKAAAQR